MRFNPNDIKKKEEVWGTYIGHRTPSFKAHSNRGQAISALKCKALYKRVNNKSDYSTKVIPEEYTLWQHNGTEWVEVIFEREYPRDQKGLIIK